MGNILTFKISIPSADGFIGRECNNPECKRYFKIHTKSFRDEMYCPYCGELFNKDQLWTQEQLAFAKKTVIEEGAAYVVSEVDKIFRDAFRNRRSRNSGFSVTYKSAGSYKKKQVSPPSERATDSELECSNCKARFQVIGLFGFCPCCREDNIIIYDTNIKILLDEITTSRNQERSLRHACNDLISTFEDYCKRKNTADKKFNFQNLNVVEKFFKDNYNKELFRDIEANKIEIIKRFFQKRHVYQHNKGIIDQKYIKIIPSDAQLLGTKASLTVSEFTEVTSLIRRIIANVI